MKFSHQIVYKVEWNAKVGEYVVVNIEQYEASTFDSENDIFF